MQKNNLRRHSCAPLNHFYLIFGIFLVSEFVSSLSFCCPGKLSFAMFFRFMFSQAISRTGDLSTDVTGMRDLTGNVVCFNVSLNICSVTFLSTYFTYLCSPCKVSCLYHIFTDFHHWPELFVQLMSLHTDSDKGKWQFCGCFFFIFPIKDIVWVWQIQLWFRWLFLLSKTKQWYFFMFSWKSFHFRQVFLSSAFLAR